MNGFKVDISIKGRKCLFSHKWYKWSENGITYWRCKKCTARRITGDNADNIDWDYLERVVE